MVCWFLLVVILLVAFTPGQTIGIQLSQDRFNLDCGRLFIMPILLTRAFFASPSQRGLGTRTGGSGDIGLLK